MASSRTLESSSFMNIPTELQRNILSLACTHGETIMPLHLGPGSARFSLHTGPAAPWRAECCPALTRKDGALPPELSAFDITRTCRRIHNMIEEEKTFYTKNEFEFFSTQDLLDHLMALPSQRRNAIRSIRVKYDYLRVPVSAFTVLAVCNRLENLTLDISGMTGFFDPGVTDFSHAPGHAQLMTLRGLKSFTFAYGNKRWTLIDDILARIPRAWISQNKTESDLALLRLLQQLEHNVGQVVSQPRPVTSLISAGELALAMNQAGISVCGDTINNALTPPSQVNSGVSQELQHNMTQGANYAATPTGQPTLSETEQWLVIDRTHLAPWDV